VNILLVEDMEDNRVLVTLLLKALPYRIELAEQGAVGVEKFQAGQYDLVFMDIQMPVMDGYEAIRLIRRWEKEQQRHATPVIALTGHTDAADIEKAQAAGFTAHLTKPLKKAALLEAIQRYAVSSSDKESAA
jgi:CheY-like chemotaxis protein